jgi:Uncharacterized conserved protein (COG2071)
MFYQLKRHPIPVRAFFRHSLVLTYALPQEVLRPLLPPGLMLDTFGEFGFLAIAMVQTESLRPVFLPRALGRNFFLSGYRIFARFKTSAGRTLRGLKILRSDTDSRMMVAFGNMLTHYAYRYATVTVSETLESLEIQITTPNAEADVHCIARIGTPAEQLPEGSPFSDLHQARLFAGPLPFTFDYEPETHSIVMIEGVREKWGPKPVGVEIFQTTFFDREPFRRARPILANAFHVNNIAYSWGRGVREQLRQV